MGEGKPAKDLRDDPVYRSLLTNFSIKLKDDWSFYLWIIQNKCGRQPPTTANVNSKWLPKLLAVRNDRDFRSAYVAFKEVYDYCKDSYGEDLFTKASDKSYERRYNDSIYGRR